MLSNQFNQLKDGHLKVLDQFVPIVARVHGASHPEFYEVKKVYDALIDELNNNGEASDLTEGFHSLREITDHYKVPSDVCESYETVYRLLAELDEAYHA